MRDKLSLCALALVFAMVACGGDDAPTTGTLKGTVKDQTSAAVGDAEVKVGDKSTKADFEGNYTLEGVPTGQVTVEISASWYQSKSESVTVKESGTTLDVTMDVAALKLDSADETLAGTFNSSFDWTAATASVRIASEPTKRALHSAVYWLNPAFYRDPGKDTVTPTPAPIVKGDGGENFEFSVGEGAEEKDVLVNSSIVDAEADTGVAQAARDAFLMWDPMLAHLKEWDLDKSTDLVLAGAAVRQQLWGGEVTEPQRIEKVFVHNDEIWVNIAFKSVVELDASITDSDSDKRKEIFAKVNPALYSQDVVDELVDNYITPKLTTLGLRDLLDELINALYDKTNPEAISAIGEPYELTGTGTFVYPFTVLKHADDAINVLLVAPSL